MEYAVPNNTEIQSSSGRGPQHRFQRASTYRPAPAIPRQRRRRRRHGQNSSPLVGRITRSMTLSARWSQCSRYRAIGTGDMVLPVAKHSGLPGLFLLERCKLQERHRQPTPSTSPSMAIDPLQQIWTDGLLPTSGQRPARQRVAGNVKNGSYPIWSKLRSSSTPLGSAAALWCQRTAVPLAPSQPDFVPISQLRSCPVALRSSGHSPRNYNGDFPGYGDHARRTAPLSAASCTDR